MQRAFDHLPLFSKILNTFKQMEDLLKTNNDIIVDYFVFCKLQNINSVKWSTSNQSFTFENFWDFSKADFIDDFS